LATQTFLPDPSDLCAFLSSASAWDGIDRRWDGDAAGRALRAQLTSALTTDQPPAIDACAGGEASLLRKDAPDPVVNVSGGVGSCGKVHLLCLGKADEAGILDPRAARPAPANAAGCAVAAAQVAYPSTAVLALLVAILVAPRRRGRKRAGSRGL
jgi:MYXO-CTERM domain-containing protein